MKSAPEVRVGSRYAKLSRSLRVVEARNNPQLNCIVSTFCFLGNWWAVWTSNSDADGVRGFCYTYTRKLRVENEPGMGVHFLFEEAHFWSCELGCICKIGPKSGWVGVAPKPEQMGTKRGLPEEKCTQ